MPKLRVYQLARELNRDNAEIIRELQHMGVPVTSHSNTVEDRLADRIPGELGGSAGDARAASDDEIIAVDEAPEREAQARQRAASGVEAPPQEPPRIEAEPPRVEAKAEPKAEPRVEPKVEEKAPAPQAKVAAPAPPAPAPPSVPPPAAPKVEPPIAAQPV